MTVPGARFVNFAEQLRREFDVTLVADGGDVPAGRDEVVPLERFDLRRAVEFDAVVAHSLPSWAMRRLRRTRTRVVYDLYVPFVTEYLPFADRPTAPVDLLFARSALLSQRLALVTGDAFVCAAERQRDFWLGALAALGRLGVGQFREDPALRNLVDVARFGLASEAPRPAPDPVLKGVLPGVGRDDRVLLWAGGAWDWTDPLTPIRALASLAARRPEIKLLFLGAEPRRGPAPEMARRARALAEELGVLGRSVLFWPWVSYAERGAFLLESDLGVSAHPDTLESRYAFRTRVVDYFWAGLPTVVTSGDELGDVVATRRLGRAVPPGDVAGWASAIEQLVDDGAERSRIRERLAAVCEELQWARVVEPLARLVRSASSPDGVPASATWWEERAVRLRISLALGGPAALARRQAAKLARRA